MSKDDESIFTDLVGQKGLNDARLLQSGRLKKDQLEIGKIHKLRAFMPTLLDYYNLELERTNPAIFKFLNPDQKSALRSKLKYTYYLLFAQFQLDSAESRKQTLAGIMEKMKQCNKLLDELGHSEDNLTPEGQLHAETEESEKYFKLLGMTTVGPYVASKIMEFVDGEEEEIVPSVKSKTAAIIQKITEVNGVRLYWVWGGGMLSSTLDMLAEDYYRRKDASGALAEPAPVTGYMSFAVYYLRGFIKLCLLLKHTIKGPWMTAEESKIPTIERFKTQWQQKKFSLLNDFIWATANMACFFWLRGKGILGYVGNVFTAGLLLMDLSLTAWRFWEETTAHNKTLFRLQQAQKEQKAALTEAEAKLKILAHNLEIGREKLASLVTDQEAYQEQVQFLQRDEQEDCKLKQEIQSLKHKIAENGKVIQKTNYDWKFKKYGTINDLVYAAGLLIAFSLLCCFFCPPAVIAAATLAIITLAGAALCFALTVATAAVTSGIELARFKRNKASSIADCGVLLQQFNSTTDENTQRMLYLEMKGLMADSEYQQRMARFQTVKFVRSILIDAFVPAIIFAALVFMPLGIGLGVLAAGLVLAVLSKILINQFEPKADQLPSFDKQVEKDFQTFKNDPEHNLAHFKKKSAKGSAFFANDSKRKDDEEDDFISSTPPFTS